MNKKVLKWNFVFQYGYVLTNIFNAVLLLPLYLKNIDKNTLGIWLATGNVLAWMTLVDPGIGEVLQQKIAELRGKEKHKEVSVYIGSGLVASAFILLIAVIVGFIFYFLLGVIIDKDVSKYPNVSMALMLTVISTGMSLVSFSMTGINQGLHNSAHVAISSLSSNFLFLLVNLVFLFTGFGVMSIAIANLARAVFINVYNITAMLNLLKKQKEKIIFQWQHFKGFIKIFSFTSASKIISGLAASIDMIVLARVIPPAMITVYEINKRPIKITQSLIGRHSVALMPVISHAKGMNDRNAIINLINKQFKFYTYALLFTSFIFCFNYNFLITVWTGPGQFAGNTIMYLLVANFFIWLIGYFMSNMSYALGDIKVNSLINISRGILIGTLMFVVAPKYGIIGTLAASLSVIMVTDFFYFTYRLHRLGYLEISLLKSIASCWAIIVPVSVLAGWCLSALVQNVLPASMQFVRLIMNAGLFTVLFVIVLLIADTDIRSMVKNVISRFILKPAYKKA